MTYWLATSSSPSEVSLPDDDPDAMVTLSKLIHHVDSELKSDLNALKNFVVVTDKYDVFQTSRHFGAACLGLLCGYPEKLNAECLATVYYFDDYQSFKKIFKVLLAKVDRVGQIMRLSEDIPVCPPMFVVRVPKIFARTCSIYHGKNLRDMLTLIQTRLPSIASRSRGSYQQV